MAFCPRVLRKESGYRYRRKTFAGLLAGSLKKCRRGKASPEQGPWGRGSNQRRVVDPGCFCLQDGRTRGEVLERSPWSNSTSNNLASWWNGSVKPGGSDLTRCPKFAPWLGVSRIAPFWSQDREASPGC